MKRLVPTLLTLLAALWLAAPRPAAAHTLRLADGRYVPFAGLVDEIQRSQLIFVGELHDNEAHHQAQLQVIHGLHQAGVPLAVGLEMFRQESQPELDAWVKGTMGEEEFRKVFEENWSMWPQYREIFLYARQQRIPLVGLNISREITRQVARNGFASLGPRQTEGLPMVRCEVDAAYMTFIRRALGNHGHGDGTFRNFCEAQLLWDTVMARTLIDHLEAHPQRTVVVLAGSGHAWKYGVPEQVRRLAGDTFSLRVLLPEIPGRLEPGRASPVEADYLMLGLDEGPLH